MNDREVLIAMLNRAGVVWTDVDDRGKQIEVEAKTGPQNDGYVGFVSVFDFDDDGALVKMGAWE